MEFIDILELFIPAFLICATLIGLLTEALKKAFKVSGTLTSFIVSIAIPLLVVAAYCIFTDTCVSAQLVVGTFFLIFMSWLGATLGFDKIKETITKIIEIIGTKGTK